MKTVLSIFTAIVALASVAGAQVPGIINYQGRVAVGGTNFNGTGQFKLSLVNAAGTTTYWSNGNSAVSLTVTKGLFSVLLGDTGIANMSSAIPATTFSNADVRLRVYFDDGVNGSQQLTPDQRLGAAGYALVANTASNATGFTGSLAGDVTGTQGATVVGTVGGVSAANVATGANAANNATAANTANRIVQRDGSGNIAVATVTGNLAGNATTATSATTATTANNFSGSLAGDVTGTQGATVVGTVGGVTAANVATGANAANNATSANTASTIVKRDGSGNIAVTTVTGNLAGNATTATTANNFSGSLAGDVTGTQGATTVGKINGSPLGAISSPASGQVLRYSGSQWVNSAIQTGDLPSLSPSVDVTGKRLNIGAGNTLSGTLATIAGGSNNIASGSSATVGGGEFNISSNSDATASGGKQNVAGGQYSTVGGGLGNRATGICAVVGGGGYDGFSIGFFGNIASGDGTTVGGGASNIATGASATIGGGGGNNATGVFSTVSGGYRSTATGSAATVGGGNQNTASGNSATVGGGQSNQATNFLATVGGGVDNVAGGQYSTVGGGFLNMATGVGAFVGGGGYDGISLFGNTASGATATVGGGNKNTASATNTTVGGGFGNQATNSYATVPGGANNLAGGQYSFAAGRQAKAIHDGAFVWADNSVFPDFTSTGTNQFLMRAAGGVGINTAAPGQPLQIGDANMLGSVGMIRLVSHDVGSIGGPVRVWDIGVPNGGSDASTTNYSFVIKDVASANVQPELVIRYITGNVGIGTNEPATKLHVAGVITCTSVTQTSDRNMKANFTPVDSRDVLTKVAALPITGWNYKEDAGTRHIGPMAQDFNAAFQVGPDDKHIAVVDESGVALAAIQGLYQELQTEKTLNVELQRRLAALEAKMDRVSEPGQQSKAAPATVAAAPQHNGL